MKFLDLFTHQHIRDVLKKTFTCSADKSDILFSADNCNEKFTILSVKGAGVEQKYVLVKIPKYLEIQAKQPLGNSRVLYPVFTIENIKNECYGAFQSSEGLDNLVPPGKNDIECLKTILQSLAEYQALDLSSNEETEKPSEYNLKNSSNEVICLDYFKNMDAEAIRESIENLQLEFNKLFECSNLLVRSIGCPLGSNIYINQDTKTSIFLSISSTRKLPPAYDALLVIFALSDEKFRQNHFEILVQHYFQSLITSLHKLQSEHADKISRIYSEHQVKVLLPVIKFERVGSISKLKDYKDRHEILSNLSHFLKYSLINQEDIYEAAKNKLGFNDFDLLDYSLVGLSEKNGHLGEYFHLDINIKTQGRKQQLQLFAKILKVSTDFQREVIESGPAKKEDFFYSTLIPLYVEHGLYSILDFSPKCYLSRINWLLVLDDLSRESYVGLKPNDVLNYEELKASVVKLAKFHACSIILEEILSEKSGEIVRLDQMFEDYLEETVLIYEDGHFLKSHYDNTLEVFCYVTEKFPEVTKILNLSSEEIRTQLKTVFLAIFPKVKNSGKIRKVVSHGDMYVANMLFKLGKSGINTEAVLIDFQLLRYATPCFDLLFFLHVSSTKETRDKYLKTLIDDYFCCLSEAIQKFNLDPEAVFPRKPFDENIKYMTSVAVVWAFAYAYFIHVDPDLRESIFRDQKISDYYFKEHLSELVDLSWKSERYRNILKGLVENVVDIIQNEC